MNPDIRKYPRTQHVAGSRLQHGDDLADVPFEDLVGKHLVVEEKVDGANCGISFNESGELLLQSRGHYLHGGPRERQFNLLKQWASTRQEELYCTIGSRYVIYGEWLYACHTYFYDALPHYFMEFDVLDTETGEFLDTPRRRELLKSCAIEPVRVIREGEFKKFDELKSHVTKSHFITYDRFNSFILAAQSSGVRLDVAMKHTDFDPRMEGLYIKWEQDGVVKGRYKFVRDTFTSSILDQEQHWHDRPIIQNMLSPGALDRMFT